MNRFAMGVGVLLFAAPLAAHASGGFNFGPSCTYVTVDAGSYPDGGTNLVTRCEETGGCSSGTGPAGMLALLAVAAVLLRRRHA
jgi:uncharacterized protein (TIGR03382 family)